MTMTPAERQRRWRERNPEDAAYQKARQRYGISRPEWELLQRVKACQICETPRRKNRRLCIDHDHSTGAVRGVLCDSCNRALGLLKESRSVVYAAFLYMKGQRK